MTTYEQLKMIYISLRKTKDQNREIFHESEYKWALGRKIAEEVGMTNLVFITRDLEATKNFLFGIEVEIDDQNPVTLKLYEDITNKIITKVKYKKPELIEYKGCSNCKFSPGPLLACDWLIEQSTIYLKCPRWEPKEKQEGSAAEKQEET